MKRRWMGVVGIVSAWGVTLGFAADPSLQVFVINQGNRANVTSAPYIKWSNVSSKQWVPADQFLLLQTDGGYTPNAAGCKANPNTFTWVIQIYTDNTFKKTFADLRAPDYYLNNNTTFVPGGSIPR